MTMVPHAVEQFAQSLAQKYRETEALLRKCGAEEHANREALRAEDVLREADQWLNEPLTLREAAETSGYSYASLQSLVRSGELPNAGEKGRPRVRRRDLPRRLRVMTAAPVRGLHQHDHLTARDDEDVIRTVVEDQVLAMEAECHEPDLDL